MAVRMVLHPVHPPGVPDALRRLDGIDLIEPPDEEGAVEALEDAPALCTFIWRPGFLTARLAWIQSISAGVDQYPLDELRERGIVVTSARGVHGPQVAEHAFALLLAMTRGVGRFMRGAAGRTWQRYMGEEVAGKRLAVIGLGAIGEEIARRGVALGMSVVGVKRTPETYEGEVREVYGPDRLVEVCRAADVVISVLPDTPETEGIFDREVFDAIGAGWFVNVGRGATVDEGALLDALDGDLRGAGLDVFVAEPLPGDSPLWDHPKVVMTPHTAGLSPAYGERLSRIVAANLTAFDGGGDWLNRVV